MLPHCNDNSRPQAAGEDTMTIRTLVKAMACAAVLAAAAPASAQETIRLRIASGHPPVNTYANLMQNFFGPEVTKRVAARTKHKVEFVHGYGGAMVKVADTLEGVQAGIIDIGGFCFCFEPSNLPLHAFQVMLPFGTMDPVTSLKVARAVYDKVPYMSKVFEDKFRQKLIALIADNGYNLGTTMEWNNVADLKGVKLAGAGLNLKWLEFAGAVPVQGSLVEAYQGLQTGVYNGWIMFPSGYVNFKLYEKGKYYTEIGFGAITWHGLTVNSARWAKLPKEVQDIILEVAREYETMTGTVNKENYPKQIAELKAKGAVVRQLPDKVRLDWANSLAKWPAQMAKELDAKGLPGTLVLETALKAAEDNGHKWPVRYNLK
ncbi:MAG: C4-dicarboxylate ABC transporter substrate-binding protein [Alphaproteobacteria bacterium]|nr:C4-dicarboxylate ABC transporter substrate-binding protein [Alphaproteobacteria bacterium]